MTVQEYCRYLEVYMGFKADLSSVDEDILTSTIYSAEVEDSSVKFYLQEGFIVLYCSENIT